MNSWKKLKLLGALVSLGATAAHAGPIEVPDDIVAEVSADALKAPAVLDNLLADYPTTRFRGVRANYSLTLKGERVISFCGEVNAVNGYGAHTGWQEFVLLEGDMPMLMLQRGTGIVGSLGPTVIANSCHSAKVTWLDGDFTAKFLPEKSDK